MQNTNVILLLNKEAFTNLLKSRAKMKVDTKQDQARLIRTLGLLLGR